MFSRLSPAKADAYKLYLVLSGIQSFAMTMVFTVNLVYQVKQVGLNPLQLVLVGTCLELTAFLMEIPTGVVADVYSRRLSVITGIALLGLGFVVEGSFPVFEALLIAQIIMGLGYTFLSGAQSAWIVDEIGGTRASAAFLRSAQVAQVTGFVAIFVSVAVASVSLQVAIVSAGIIMLALALFLVLLMPEEGFKRQEASQRENWTTLFATFRSGLRLVRRRRLLLLIMAATIIHGAFSEGFDRLWTAHLLGNFTLPALGQLDEIVWFGVISAVGMPLSLLAMEYIGRGVDMTSNRSVTLALTVVYVAMIAGVLLFTLGESFALLLLGLWITGAMRAIRNPLMEAWINQHTESGVRATVLSIQGQADAFGQIAGGPVVGAIGHFSSVRMAITISALMLVPILGVFRRSSRPKR
ncbi:MAG: MFS transporter [Chloroflexi bacterium]|nr:MFS transporter [Chloroflexota bacterium]